MELIVTEKENVARRIADILSDGTASTEQVRGETIYKWGGKRVIGLSGHVVGVDFTEEYSDWTDVEPADLIDAEVVKRPTQESIVNALQALAEDADRVTIATDYDREGELIGKEAYELVRGVNQDVPIDRVRFSSITENEVTEAFEHPDSLDFDLAEAGEARQIIDLMWGAALTRFLSLAAKQYGDDFISVGRVQSPTLKLIVDREREIEAFEPDDYWELFTDLAKTDGDTEPFEAQYFYLDESGNEAERIWVEADAEAAFEDINAATTAEVSEVNRRTRTDRPPAPFNTTQFIRAAGAIGYSAKRAMSLAEDLYTAGYITYPRTDNTVYPDDLNPEELISAFANTRSFGEDATDLLRGEGTLTPTRGDTKSTDHPPIHPTTDIPDQGDLTEDQWNVYELVVRRFFATVAEPATWEHLRVVAEVDGRSLKANGKRLLDPGYHAVYPYFNTSENFVPDVEEGETLDIEAVELEAKQTEPPRRYGQSRLIELMEDLGIGTKATRHNTLDKLYDRGYIENDPPRPTQLAHGVVTAAEEYADMVVSESMTAQLEEDMTAIANGEASLEEITDESREMLERIFEELEASEEEIGEQIREALKADKALGPCPDCGERLLIRKSRHGSHFVGCDGYPDCEYTLPLPNKGEPLILDEVCADHDLKHVKMLAGRGTFVHGCPQCQADEADEEEDQIIGTCPDCSEDHGGELAIKRVRSGSRLVGCTRYPDCDYSLPLPRRGDLEITDTHCDEHDLPELVIHNGDEPWELGCPICNYEEYTGQRDADDEPDEDELKSIKGIGTKTAEKLETVGIETVTDLTDADVEAIADDVEGISVDRLRDWQARAEG
ncbi:MAG: DNA topoisomerase I [Halobacteriales archaeon]|nr:DNA topoisomerase I [Halobacteriales archaeon]